MKKKEENSEGEAKETEDSKGSEGTKKKIIILEDEKTKKESKDEEGLEEILIDEPDFSELRMQEIGFRAPVLSQMAEIPRDEGLRLEAEVGKSPTTNNEDDSFSYRAKSGNSEERKYSSYSDISINPESVDVALAGRTRQSISAQEVSFNPSMPPAENNFSSGETYIPVERTNVESAGKKRKSDFEELGKVERRYEAK